MILGSVFLDVAVIRHDRTILRDQCGFPYLKKCQNKDINNKIIKSVKKDKSNY